MEILLIGPQGSGKSTQAEKLARFLGVPNVETGQIFRDLAKDQTSLGQRVREILKSGGMVDDETTAELVKVRLAQPDCQAGFVMNGYPRSPRQQGIFSPKFDRVFYLVVPDEVVTQRQLKRGREDDTPELIKKRLDHYHLLTEPLIDYSDPIFF